MKNGTKHALQEVVAEGFFIEKIKPQEIAQFVLFKNETSVHVTFADAKLGIEKQFCSRATVL